MSSSTSKAGIDDIASFTYTTCSGDLRRQMLVIQEPDASKKRQCSRSSEWLPLGYPVPSNGGVGQLFLTSYLVHSCSTPMMNTGNSACC